MQVAFFVSEIKMMKDLVASVQTMGSREIAELTGKEHRNVKRDCETMFSELEIDVLSFEHIYFKLDNCSNFNP